MFRFGLSGTNWTRKTSTIKLLIPRLAPASVDSLSLSPLVARSPYPMIENQTVAGSEWMVEQVGALTATPHQSDYQVFDRTPLDIMAFTRYALDIRGGDVTVCDRIAELSSRFEVIFFCRPSGEWPSPVSPTDDKRDFALRIDDLMASSRSLLRTQILEVPWAANERVDTILNYLATNGR